MAKDRRSSDRQARRRDNQGSKPPAEGPDPLRTRARAAPAGLGVKGERKQARAEAGRAGGGGGVPPAVAGEGEGAEKLRSPRPAPEGSTTPREERLPRRGAGLMRPRCEQHHGWLGAGLAPPPSQAPLRDQGARPRAGSARGGGPSLGAPHHGTDRGGGDAVPVTTTPQLEVSRCPVRCPHAPEPSVHSPTFPRLLQNPP